MKPKVIVVGGGINGLALAFSFVQNSYKVLIVDKASIPNKLTASYLDTQIIRPQYVENDRLGLRVSRALTLWRDIFHELRENFFSPTGVMAISRHDGDWADLALHRMRDYELPFQIVHSSILKDMYPAMRLENVRKGVLSDIGGQIRGQDLMNSMVQYLKEKGVEFIEGEVVTHVQSDGLVETERSKYQADWVVVTSAHSQLTPYLEMKSETFLGCYLDVAAPLNERLSWKFSPIWVDLGRNENCWGIPRTQSMNLRLGAGIYSEDIEKTDAEIQENMFNLYDEIIRDFHHYMPVGFHRVAYQGTKSGDFTLRKEGQVIGLSADSGHGFKFAPVNAETVVNAIENDTLTIAARQIAGV